MRIRRTLNAPRNEQPPVVLTAGFFDGFHLGHRKVLDRTLALARESGSAAWAMTFDTHPLHVLKPDAAPLLLTSTPHKIRLLTRTGLDGCLVVPFTYQLAAMPPTEFVERLCRCMPRLRHIVVGPNWRFGQRASGTPRTLADLGRRLDFRVTVVPALVRDGRPVSSTRIRDAVKSGRLDEAARFLGRPFSVLGSVVQGRTVGRTIGFPTANIEPINEVLPPRGVYAVQALVDPRRGKHGGELLDGVCNLGVRPTFLAPHGSCSLELHAFDFDRSLYGTQLEVFFLKRLRAERQFPAKAQLKRQIAADTRRARAFLTEYRKEQRIPLHGQAHRTIVPAEKHKVR